MCEDKGRGNFQRCKLTVYEIGNVRGRGKRLLSGVDIDNKNIQLLRSLMMMIIKVEPTMAPKHASVNMRG